MIRRCPSNEGRHLVIDLAKREDCESCGFEALAEGYRRYFR
ncbi:hypothetical protein [Amycolatopsis sp. lyj-90]